MVARTVAVSSVALLVLAGGLSAEDWSQWRGPDRQAVWTEQGIVDSLR